MSARRISPWFLALVISATAIGSKAQTPSSQPAATVPIDQPSIKIGKGGEPDKRFVEMHRAFLERGKEGKIGLLFLGDSITEGWNKAPQIWQDHYGNLDPANFGIGGDRTEHVLWRIANGELDGIHPKVLVLLIGTNNIGSPAPDIAAADKKIVAEIHEKLPDTKVLILGIFPRGANPENPLTAQMRDKIKFVNSELAKLDDGNQTRFLDFGDKYLNSDGIIRYSIMPDALHPSVKGYQIWADTMQPLLDEMMKKSRNRAELEHPI